MSPVVASSSGSASAARLGPGAAERLATAFQALRHAGYRPIVVAGVLVATGGFAFDSAVAAQVFHLSGGSALVQAAYFAYGAAPFLVVPPLGGMLADRFDRRRVWLGCLAVISLATFALAVAERGGSAPLPLVFVLVGIVAAGGAAATPPQQALVAGVVPGRALSSAVGLLWGSYALAAVLGPLVAVPVIARAGTAGVCALQSATALAAMALVLQVPAQVPTTGPRTDADHRAPNGALSAALRHAMRSRAVLPVVGLTAAGAFFGMSVSALLVVFAFAILRLPFAGFSAFLVAGNLGALVGALAAASTGPRAALRQPSLQLCAVGLALGGFALARDARLSIALFALVSCLSYWLLTSLEAILQRRVDDAHRGRVMAAYLVVRIGLVPIGALVLGAVAQAAGPPAAVLAYGAAMLVCGAAALLALALTSSAMRH